MSGHIKYFQNSGKNMSFITKDDRVLDKHNEIWYKIKKMLNIKFHSMPVYDERYIKTKVKEFNGAIKTNFLADEIPKGSMHYTCISCRTIDSVMRMEKNNYPQAYSEDRKYRMKKIKTPKLESELELESDAELESKSQLESGTE